jgi:hypothetical protein
MAVIQTTLWDAAAGRTAEAVAHMAQAKRIHQRLGGKVRALQIQLGGTTAQRLVYSLHYENMSAYASMGAALAADSEWIMFQQTVLGSPSPSATLVSNALSREIAGFEGPFAATGKSVGVLTQIRVHPGGMEGVLSEIKVVKGVFGKLGAALSARQAFMSGDTTGMIAVAVTYADLKAFGKGMDGLFANADYAGVLSRMGAKDAPGTILSRTQAVELAI